MPSYGIRQISGIIHLTTNGPSSFAGAGPNGLAAESCPNCLQIRVMTEPSSYKGQNIAFKIILHKCSEI